MQLHGARHYGDQSRSRQPPKDGKALPIWKLWEGGVTILADILSILPSLQAKSPAIMTPLTLSS